MTTATEKRTLSMEELFTKRASQQMVAEANAFKTIPKGMYRLRATKYEATQNELGRTTIWFSVDILDNEGNRKAKGSVKVSPDEVRTAKGFQDTQTKLYGQLVKALGLLPEGEAEQPNAGEVIQAFMSTPVDGFVALSFKGPKNPATGYAEFMDPKTEEEEAQFRSRGYTPINIVRSLQKVA